MHKDFDWETFIDSTYNLYMSIAVNMLEHQEEARDVVQTVYMKLFEKNYDQNYLKTIGAASVKNACINIARDANRRLSGGAVITLPQYPDHMQGKCFQDPYAHYIDPVLEVMERDLPPNDMAIIMAYAEGYKYKELADLFKIPIGTVKFKIHSIRKYIRKLFPELLDSY